MKLLNTNQAAAKLGISARRVRALIAAGTLKAHHIGQEWAIEEAALAHVTVYRKPGRPPASKAAKKAKKGAAKAKGD